MLTLIDVEPTIAGIQENTAEATFERASDPASHA